MHVSELNCKKVLGISTNSKQKYDKGMWKNTTYVTRHTTYVTEDISNCYSDD